MIYGVQKIQHPLWNKRVVKEKSYKHHRPEFKLLLQCVIYSNCLQGEVSYLVRICDDNLARTDIKTSVFTRSCTHVSLTL